MSPKTMAPLPAGPSSALKPGAAKPGRPEAGPATGRRTAICCSGGGIRSAAFTLGALQRLDRPEDAAGSSYYRQADFVTAVSGGSYMAAAFAVAYRRHALEKGRHDEAAEVVDPDLQPKPDLPPVRRPYAPGSPEDTRLRTHTRYLVEDRIALAGGLLGILYGLVLNLVPLLAITYLASAATAAALTRGLHILRWDSKAGDWQAHQSAGATWAVIVVLILAGAVFAYARLTDLYRRVPRTVRQMRIVVSVTISLAALGAVLAVALIAVPELLAALKFGSHQASHSTGTAAKTQVLSVGATLSALLPIVAGVLRKTAKEAKTVDGALAKNRTFASARARVSTLILPWLGAIVITLLFLGTYVTWTSVTASLVAHDPHHGFWVRLAYEWWPVAAAALALLLWHAVTDLNRDSLHAFYANRVAFAFGAESGADAPGHLLSGLQAESDAPPLVLCATANIDQVGIVPTGRRCVPVTFSPWRSGMAVGSMYGKTGPGVSKVGLPDLEQPDAVTKAWEIAHANGESLMIDTDEFEARADRKQMSVFDLVAVSGAAVAPIMGRMTRPSVRLLLGIANVGLGMWLPNPLNKPTRRAPQKDATLRSRFGWQRLMWQLHQPGLRALFWELFGGSRLMSHWIYVTDGGHYENLGLVEALRRGATEVTVLDASGDSADTWSTLAQAVETARTDLGVEIDIDPTSMVEGVGNDQHVKLAITGSLLFPDGTTGTIYYCKLQKGSAVPWDIRSRYLSDKTFPVAPTSDQLYGDLEFESYRMLGWCAADEARALSPDDPPPPGGGDDVQRPKEVRTFASHQLNGDAKVDR